MLMQMCREDEQGNAMPSDTAQMFSDELKHQEQGHRVVLLRVVKTVPENLN